MNFYNYQSQGHLLTFVLDASDSVFLSSCGAPVGWGNESLFIGFGLNDEDIRYAHVW